MSTPAQETEIIPIERGSGIARDQRGLGEKSPGAAHRIDQLTSVGRDLRPSGAQQHAAATFSFSGARPPSVL